MIIKGKKHFLITIPLILFISLLLFTFDLPLSINHLSRSYTHRAVNDEIIGGRSSAEIKHLNNGLEISSVRRDVIDNAYTGVEVFRNEGKLFDLSKYDILELEIEPNNIDSLLLNLYIYVEGFTDLNDFDTYYPVEYYLTLDRDIKKYKVNLKEFIPITWWINMYSIDKEITGRVSKDSIILFSIFDFNSEYDVRSSYILKKLEFRSNSLKLLYIGTFMFLYYISFYLSILLKGYFKKKKNNFIPYRVTENFKDDGNFNLIEDYLGNSYTNQLLNMNTVSEETGISSRKISLYIKDKYAISFPEFLNSIRIEEAKRLLESTDQKILDIAMSVGYNSLAHFNRSFKKREDCTPKEFRKLKKAEIFQ